MAIYPIEETDKFINVLVAHPQYDIFCTNFSSTANVAIINGSPQGFGFNTKYTGSISLRVEELNNPGVSINPFVVKGSSNIGYRTMSVTDFSSDFLYGQVMTGNYDHSSSISSLVINGTMNQQYLGALRNILEYNGTRNPIYSISGTNFNKNNQIIRMIQIPSMFFGSTIEKGSVELRLIRRNSSGSLDTTKSISILKDSHLDGNLVQTYDSDLVENSSSYDNLSAGMVLYKQGIILLTGSWALTTVTSSGNYSEIVAEKTPRWYHYGEVNSADDYYCYLKFKGTSKIPVRTVFSRAPIGELNNSCNPTFLAYGQSSIYGSFSGSLNLGTSSYYNETDNVHVANTHGDRYSEHVFTVANTSSFGDNFQRQTYISKVLWFDKNKIPVAVVKLASPLKKTEGSELTIKSTFDI